MSVFAEPLAQARDALTGGHSGRTAQGLAALGLIEQRATELLALAELGEAKANLIEAAANAEQRATDMEKALRQALDCKGSYNGTVSERGGEPAICTKCEEAVRAALSAREEAR